MRVVLTCHRFPPDGIAGVERYTQSLAAELVRAGHVVAVITRRMNGSPQIAMARERLPDGTVLYRLTGGAFCANPFHDQVERLEQLFLNALIEAAPDVVHVNHLLGLPPQAIELAQRQHAGVVVSLHDFYFACPLVHLQKPSGELCAGPAGGQECARTCFAHEGAAAGQTYRLRFAYYRRSLALADQLICPSRYVASFFERLGVAASRLRVIPNGVFIDAAKTAPVTKADGRLRLAVLGTVVPHKGAHVVLEALRLAGLRAVDLLVLGQHGGDPTYVRQLRGQAAAVPGLKLCLYGSYSPADLTWLLDGVDCVISPSQVAETFSLTTREALIRGIPVLVARLGALPEAVIDNNNGFTFDPRRPDELAALLTTLDADPSCLDRLREGARRTPVWLMPEHAAAVTAVYAEAVRGVARAGPARAADRQELELFDSMLRSRQAA